MNKHFKKIIVALIVIATLLRLTYVIKTPYDCRQHDIGDYTVEGSNGGLEYILTIYNTNSLPQDNYGQHYHPPLHQILSAMWLKVASIFTDDLEIMFESLQFLTLIYSVLLLIVIYLILKEINLKNKYIIAILAILAFHPTLLILSGSLNNDILCLLLIMCAVLWLIKWHKKENIKSTIMLALFTGLAVMTKTSGAIVALPIIYIFLLKLYRAIKQAPKGEKFASIKKYIMLYIIFGIIALPIGTWYLVRNYILFDQPIMYILDPKVQDQYRGDYSLLERFLIPDINEINKLYSNTVTDHNIPAFLIKSSLFGEYFFATKGIYSVLARISVYICCGFVILGIYSVISNIIRSIKNKENREYKWILFLLMLFNLASFCGMNYKLPYGCSMDFRYVVTLLFVFLIFIMYEIANIKNKKVENVLYWIVSSLLLVMTIFADLVIFLS